MSCSLTARGALSSVPGIRIVGTAAQKTSVLSFVMENVHPHDIGTILDQEGVAIRTGHHCTQPLMERMRRAGHGPRIAGAVQYEGRDRRAGSRLDKVREIFD
jgi:cysteine desulfurase/selenocysteine lyase